MRRRERRLARWRARCHDAARGASGRAVIRARDKRDVRPSSDALQVGVDPCRRHAADLRAVRLSDNAEDPCRVPNHDPRRREAGKGFRRNGVASAVRPGSGQRRGGRTASNARSCNSATSPISMRKGCGAGSRRWWESAFRTASTVYLNALDETLEDIALREGFSIMHVFSRHDPRPNFPVSATCSSTRSTV